MLYESFHYLTNSDDSIHIGLKIDSDQSDLTQKWAWIDNRTVSWTNWGPSQPAINTGDLTKIAFVLLEVKEQIVDMSTTFSLIQKIGAGKCQQIVLLKGTAT